MPACFVTSLEMKKTPLLGQITLAAGCLFVDRKNRTNIEKEVENVVDGLKNKLNVCIFPEAKSTNGDEVLLFRKSMFNAAILANSPILPLTMNYQSIDGQKLTRSNRDQLFWYGDMTFYPHILSVLKLNEIKLKIKVHPLVKVADKESDIDLANRVQKIVAKDYQNLSHS
jgi:1-acyl-sn-glycerol-3-phosphate acyltransferase